jgi:uncharacterized protein (TIGR02246 family)
MDETQRNETVAAVEAAMRSFEAAERALDPERLVAHFAPVEDFLVYNDGERVTYDVMVAGVRRTFPTLRSIEGGFSDLQVIVLGPDAALVAAAFREAITDEAGNTARARGAATWLWRRTDGDWRIVYGHVDHYPEP